MRPAARILAMALLVVMAGCAAKPPAATPNASPDELLGTWRMDAMTEGTTGKRRAVTDPTFIQFYEDGSVASWSAAGMGEVAHGRYRIRDGRLQLSGVGNKGLPFGVTPETWWYQNEGGDRCFYRRVRPDLPPGRVP
jgi:hypothetical protein